MDREAWCAAAHMVTKSRTWLSYWTELSIQSQWFSYSDPNKGYLCDLLKLHVASQGIKKMYVFNCTTQCLWGPQPRLSEEGREPTTHLSQGGGRDTPVLACMLWLGSASLDPFLLVTESVQLSSKAGPSLLGQKPGILLVCCTSHALCFAHAVLAGLSLSSQLLHGLGLPTEQLNNKIVKS